MERLRRFPRLPTEERWLLIKTALLLEGIKLAMPLLPFRVLRRLLARGSRKPGGRRRAGHPSREKITWAVQTACRNTPGLKTCLARALAAQVLLARHGYPALLRIGVARGEQGQFQAHAWVETEGNVVIGGRELEGFTPLAALEVEGS